MIRALRITSVAVHRFRHQVTDLEVDDSGFNYVYKRGSCLNQTGYVLTVGTDAGITGEYVGGTGRFLRSGRDGRAVPVGQEPTRARADLQRSQARLTQTRSIGHRPDRHHLVGYRRQIVRRASLGAAGRFSDDCPGVREHVPRRRQRRSEHTGSFRRVRSPLSRHGLSRLQDP
jgi:hypothetical protein